MAVLCCCREDVGPDRALEEVRLLRAQYDNIVENDKATSAAGDCLELTSLDAAITAARLRRRRVDVDFHLRVLDDTQFCLNLSEETVSLHIFSRVYYVSFVK